MYNLYSALAIYCQSPAPFEALSSFKLLQLPGAYTLKRYTRSNKENPGECDKILEREKHIKSEPCTRNLTYARIFGKFGLKRTTNVADKPTYRIILITYSTRTPPRTKHLPLLTVSCTEYVTYVWLVWSWLHPLIIELEQLHIGHRWAVHLCYEYKLPAYEC